MTLSADLVPISNVEAERALVGGLLMHPANFDKIRGIVTPGSFYNDRVRLVFEAIGELVTAGKPTDQTVVADRLQARRVRDNFRELSGFEYVGGYSFIGELLEAASLSSEIQARLVRKSAILRGIVELGDRAVTAARSGEDPEQLLATLEGDLIGLSSAQNGDRAPLQLGDLVYAQFEQLSVPLPTGLVGIPTGSRRLNYLTAGWQGGKTYYFVGRPGTGKTAKVYWHGKVAAQAGYWAHCFSLEMPDEEIGLRALADLSGVDSSDLQLRRLSVVDEENARRAVSQACVPFTFDTEIFDFDRIMSRMRQLAREGCRLFVIDYLLLLESDKRFDRDDLRIANFTRSIKKAAKQLRVPILVPTQYKKDNQESIPNKGDIFGASAIENDADYIELMYSPADVGEVPNHSDFKDREKHIELISGIVAKHRGGRTGLVNYRFNKPTATYEEWTHEAHGKIRLLKGGER